MMQTSDLNHNPMHSSHQGKIGKHYRSRILIDGQNMLLFILPAQYYINAHPYPNRGSTNNNQIPRL